MMVKELISLMNKSDRLRIINAADNETLYCNFIAMKEYDSTWQQLEEKTIRHFNTHQDMSHKKWKELGLRAPLMKEEAAQYSFQDLQMTLYHDIYI